MDKPNIVKNFYGVYILYCENPQYKGRIYIGYTVDPVKRLKKHNAGKKFGGAWKTSNRGPWNMVLIVHGFPNPISALRFEWAWQHPDVSRRLRHVRKKKCNEKVFDYKLNVLSAMLQVGPWCRLPLTLRWLDETVANIHSSQISPPMHMPICYGPILACKNSDGKKSKNSVTEREKEYQKSPEDIDFLVCDICYITLTKDELLTCPNLNCNFIAHIICLANHFIKDQAKILPVQGVCPHCKIHLLWAEIIREKNNCNKHYSIISSSDSD